MTVKVGHSLVFPQMQLQRMKPATNIDQEI